MGGGLSSSFAKSAGGWWFSRRGLELLTCSWAVWQSGTTTIGQSFLLPRNGAGCTLFLADTGRISPCPGGIQLIPVRVRWSRQSCRSQGRV